MGTILSIWDYWTLIERSISGNYTYVWGSWYGWAVLEVDAEELSHDIDRFAGV